MVKKFNREAVLEMVGGMLALFLVIAIVVASYRVAHVQLMRYGLGDAMWQSAAIWWGVGIICALAWPLRCYEGMRGYWKAAAPQIALLSLTGPWALLLGIPF